MALGMKIPEVSKVRKKVISPSLPFPLCVYTYLSLRLEAKFGVSAYLQEEMLAFHEAHFSLAGVGDFTGRFLFHSLSGIRKGKGEGRGRADGYDDDGGGGPFEDLGGFGLDGHDRIHELLRRGYDDGDGGSGREGLALGGELEGEQDQSRYQQEDREQEQEWYGPGEGNRDGYDEWYDDDEEEDDGLGYYPDGVKRTLTDDQIAIFRHSEMEALKRAAGKKAEAEANRKSFAGAAGETAAREEGRGSAKRKAELSDGEEEEEGEISSATPPLLVPTEKKSKKRRKKRKNGLKDGEEPVDLRKRTWDVVDTGLATLDYGEEEGEDGGARGGEGRAVQRRTVSYDD
jgi:hypothetical protein